MKSRARLVAWLVIFLVASSSVSVAQGVETLHESTSAFRDYLRAHVPGSFAIDASGCASLADLNRPSGATRRASLGCDEAQVTLTVEQHERRWFAPFLWRWRTEEVSRHRVLGLSSSSVTPPPAPAAAAPALPPISEENVTARSMRLRSRGYVAIGFRDLNGDGKEELVLVDREAHVEVYQRERNRLRRLAYADLPATPRAVPRRRIFGTTAHHRDGLIIELSSRPFSFLARMNDGELRVEMTETDCPDGAHLVNDVCARPVDGRDYFMSALEPRGENANPTRAQGSFYQLRRGAFGTAEERVQVAALVTPQGRLAVVVDGRPSGVMGHGAALALGDLDRDGAPEILTSSSAEEGRGDHLMITRARRDGVILSVWRSGGVGGSVLLADAGDMNGDGRDAFVAIEEPREGGRARAWVVSCCE